MTEWTITRLGAQGDGIADGPVFAPRTLPGEIVSGALSDGVLTDVKIVSSSDNRVAPPCRHFKSCGGCVLQHGSDDFVANWKTERVQTALAAQGLETVFRPIVTSPPATRRRASFAARRTKTGALVGFHGRKSDTIIAVPDCTLLDPKLSATMGLIEDIATTGTSRKAVLSVLVTVCDNGLDFAVSGGKPLDRRLRQHLAVLCQKHGILRLTWDGEVVAMESKPQVSFGDIKVSPPPSAFLQATRHGETQLVQTVQEIATGAGRIVDLFAGCGTFSLPLARTASVHAVEGEKEMLSALDEGWRHARSLKTVTTEARDLFRRPLMADEFRHVDLVVIDPPRAGAVAQIAELATCGVPRIAHVSCNPVTFARDAACLVQTGYHLDWVQVVDQFRWSAHVELVGCFSLPHIRR
ncbi:MAG: class I SAM-dependent RNA methyltransferase [Roseobacter sp.]